MEHRKTHSVGRNKKKKRFQTTVIKKLQDRYHNNKKQDMPDKYWRIIQTAIKNEATKSIIMRNNKVLQKEWYDKKCRKLNTRKTEVRNKLLIRHTRNNLQHYKELRAVAEKRIKRKKREFLKRKYLKLKQLTHRTK